MWHSQLTKLILSFYREDRSTLQQLQYLKACKLSRRWGSFQIRCTDCTTAKAVIDTVDLIREPIAALKLAQQIKITVNNSVITTVPVHTTKLST